MKNLIGREHSMAAQKLISRLKTAFFSVDRLVLKGLTVSLQQNGVMQFKIVYKCLSKSGQFLLSARLRELRNKRNVRDRKRSASVCGRSRKMSADGE